MLALRRFAVLLIGLIGVAVVAPAPAKAATASDPKAVLTLDQSVVQINQIVTVSTSGTRPGPSSRITRVTISFGDGTPRSVKYGSPVLDRHRYQRAGRFVITLIATDSKGRHGQTTRLVVVNHAPAVVPRTGTHTIPGSAVAVANYLDSDHARLQVNTDEVLNPTDTLVVQAGAEPLPAGFLGRIDAVRPLGGGGVEVDTTRVGLADAYSTLSVAYSGKPVVVSQQRTGRSTDLTALPLKCESTAKSPDFGMTANFSDTKVTGSLDLASQSIHFIFISNPVISVKLGFKEKATCELDDGFSLTVPTPLPAPLQLKLKPIFEVSASGSFGVGTTITPHLFAGFDRAPGVSQDLLQFRSSASVTSAYGAATGELFAGAGIELSVADRVGVIGKIGPVISTSIAASTDKVCANLYGALRVQLQAYADVFFKKFTFSLYKRDFGKIGIVNSCFSATGGSGSGGSTGSGPTPGTTVPGSTAPPGPTSVEASNNNGDMRVQLHNFPLGRTYYFCHFGDPATFPTGGDTSQRGQFNVTSYEMTFARGLCAGSGNAWIGLQGSDGNDYYSGVAILNYVAPQVSASNNNGELAIQLANFPSGTTYFFCHFGDPSGFPTGGSVPNHGQFQAFSSLAISSHLCSGSGPAWIGLQAPDGRDYYSNVVTLERHDPGLVAGNNSGQMTVQLTAFPQGQTYYFCHSGTPDQFPTGGVVTSRGSVNVASGNEFFDSGLCSGRGNAWIGLQGTDGHDYYSNQVDLYAPPTPGASVSASNNNGQMAVQLANFPHGTTYFFCHSGGSDAYPTGGVITNHGSFNVTTGSEGFASGLCSGRGNAWIGLQGADGHDYYSNQVDLYAPPSPGASVTATSTGGQMTATFANFPLGTTYFFCHAGESSGYPTGGSVPSRGQITITSPNQSFGGICSGSGNFWIGVQATDGHDYYSNQIVL